MKLRITRKAVAAMAAVIAFALLFSACTANWFYPEIEMGLTSVKIGDLIITGIPAPIPGEDWDDEEYEVAGSDLGFVIVKKEADLEDQPIIATANPPTALVTWGRAKGGIRPARFDELRSKMTFDKTDFLFFRVYDPDTRETKYYRFFPRDASVNKELVGLSVAGRDPDKIPTNVPDMETLQQNIAINANYRGIIFITRKEALEGALVAATPKDVDARIEYAVAPSAADAQDGKFGEFVEADRVVVQDEQGKDVTQAHDSMTFTDGNIIAVKVTAQNDEFNYYGFQVYTERMAAIASLQFDSNEVTGKGTPHAQWGSVAAGSYASADQNPNTGFNIRIQLEDGEGSAEWALINNAGAAQPGSFTPFIPGAAQRFTHKQALAIKVNSPRKNNSDTRYYKVEINLLAAKFTRQPLSAAYTITDFSRLATVTTPGETFGRILVDDPANEGVTVDLDRDIVELSFALDRPDDGFTYQWYTANSWYGGYGFDRDGRLVGDPRTVPDYYHPDPNKLDEKNNVSFHNGGNQFYRLSIPGRPIQGATGKTYKPTIDARNRPFITGFANQTQYYWVVVTSGTGANALKATSARAAIVAEWGREFKQGVPGDAIVKKHHIVDMNAYLDPNAVGLKDNPRNATPFKAGNHGDQYLIPMTLPSGFNIKDYSIVTAWAKFYLADGTEWIQNWTQGDFGFANGSQDSLVLWYNLTNDNATRGLAGSGNDPQGSGLDENPAYLIVKPAGTKPMKEMPPFSGIMSSVTGTWPQTYTAVYGQDDRPKPEENNNAQGWFTPYIEIVELRFEGPAR